MPTDKQIEAGLAYYQEGGCMGLSEDERREVVMDILTAAEQADKTQTKHAQQERVYRNTEPRDGFVEDGMVPIDKWGPPTEGGSTLPEPRLRPHNASSFHEPFGYWVKHKYSDGVLLRKPSYIPKADYYTDVIPLYTRPSEQAVTEAMVEAGLRAAEEEASTFIFDGDFAFADGFSDDFKERFRTIHRAALKAALEA